MDLTNTETLAAIEEIRQLKARYCRTIDRQDWAGYQGVFTDDVIVDIRDETGGDPVVGAETYVGFLAPILEGVKTTHHVHSAEITITGDDSAEGIWAMEDHLWFPSDTGGSKSWGTGWYEESYRRVGGEWRIAKLRLRRQRVEFDGVQSFPPPTS